MLYLTAYVRAAALTANQLVTIPGGGDFRIGGIAAARELVSMGGDARGRTLTDAELPVLALPDADR